MIMFTNITSMIIHIRMSMNTMGMNMITTTITDILTPAIL